MHGLLILQLLAFDPTESYLDLTPHELAEKRRSLLEERPSLAPPIIALVFASVGGFAATWMGFDAQSRFAGGCYSLFDGGPTKCYAAAILGTLAAGALVYGTLLLLQHIPVHNSITARIEEVEALLDLYRPPPAQPAPPP
jgi:hypothetical protein